MTERKVSAAVVWACAVMFVAATGATCFAIHFGLTGWGVWFAASSVFALAVANKAS